MGCFERKRDRIIDESQKWDFITLSDFHASSVWTGLSYAWLWFLAIVGVAVFVADCFTAINLLAFDHWSSTIQPYIPFQYSRWIFAACILVSTALYAYEWQRAIRIIRRGGVAESYMDRIAFQVQCMRGKGWKRFLVFAELTKSKKGADYVALFVHFQFSSAWRIIFAEAGRQVVNALTLYSVMKADLIPVGKHAATNGSSSFVQFFHNISILFDQNREQGVILFTMLFTLVIFVFSALSLIAALILYLTFLWHYIPQSDGRLCNYCKRKIDKRLETVVEAKVKAAVALPDYNFKSNKLYDFEKPGVRRQPTLPDLEFADDKKSSFGLSAQYTPLSVRSWESKSSLSDMLKAQPSLPNLQSVQDRPFFPTRTDTMVSDPYSLRSYDSNAPLLRNANGMGSAEPSYPMVAMPRGPAGAAYPLQRPMAPPGMRSMTPVSQRSYGSPSSGSQGPYGSPFASPHGPKGSPFSSPHSPYRSPSAGPQRPYGSPSPGPPPGPPGPYGTPSPAPQRPYGSPSSGPQRSYGSLPPLTVQSPTRSFTDSVVSGPSELNDTSVTTRSAKLTPPAVELPDTRSVVTHKPPMLHASDSFERTVPRSSFNRPFPRNDRPNIAPALTTGGSSNLPLRRNGGNTDNTTRLNTAVTELPGSSYPSSPMSASSYTPSPGGSLMRRNVTAPMSRYAPAPLRQVAELPHDPPVPQRSATDPMHRF